MHEQPVRVLDGERQAGKELPLGRIELAAGPFHRDLRLDIEMFVPVSNGVVMIAEDCDSALSDQVHHHGHCPVGIGAIADIVAEQDEALGAVCPRLSKARVESLSVGVNVGEERNQHCHDLTPLWAPSHAGQTPFEEQATALLAHSRFIPMPSARIRRKQSTSGRKVNRYLHGCAGVAGLARSSAMRGRASLARRCHR
jgi:hypothetical protein